MTASLHNETTNNATLVAILEDTRDLLANCLDYGNECSKQYAQLQIEAITSILTPDLSEATTN